MDDLEEFTDEQLHEEFVLLHRLKGEAKAFRVPTQESQSQLGLFFEIEQHGQIVRRAVLMDRQDLVDLARQILSALDPVTNEQILARIRKLMEDRS